MSATDSMADPKAGLARTTAMPGKRESDRLVDLRWVVALVVLALILGTSTVVEAPVVRLLAIVGVFAASNVALKLIVDRAANLGRLAIGAVLLFDLALLTVGLWISGGPMNPFSFLYVVYVALGATVTRGAIPWVVSFTAILGYGLLYFVEPQGHHHHGQMRLHLEGMWMAMAITALMTVAFMQVLQRALAASERRLQQAKEEQERERRLTALTTLAAGAAHELTTPLSTIALVSRDLEERLTGDTAGDAAVIREQVERCKSILRSMANSAGRSVGESAEPISLSGLVREVADEFDLEFDLEVSASSTDPSVIAPRQALGEALRSLVQNATDAGGSVAVRVGEAGELFFVEVADTGSGIAPELVDRVTEPFFSTKDRDDRMGLGLFVVNRLARELGGRLEITSGADGTNAKLLLPRG